MILRRDKYVLKFEMYTNNCQNAFYILHISYVFSLILWGNYWDQKATH